MPPLTALPDRIREVFRRHTPPGRQLVADTNFFEAGFTSDRLTEVLAALAGAGIELSLLDLFQYPTLRELIAEATRRVSSARQPGQQHQLPWRQ